MNHVLDPEVVVCVSRPHSLFNLKSSLFFQSDFAKIQISQQTFGTKTSRSHCDALRTSLLFSLAFAAPSKKESRKMDKRFKKQTPVCESIAWKGFGIRAHGFAAQELEPNVVLSTRVLRILRGEQSRQIYQIQTSVESFMSFNIPTSVPSHFQRKQKRGEEGRNHKNKTQTETIDKSKNLTDAAIRHGASWGPA